jgi:murein DD-endopeptidase MepM/ murein hydrolase activator NlpD
LNQALAAAKEKAQQESGMEITTSYNTVETKISHSLFAAKMDSKELTALLEEEVDWLAPGATLNINNGEIQFAVATEADGQKVLDKLKEQATADAGDAVVKSVEFQEDVSIETGNVKVSEIQSPTNILEQIQEGTQEVKTHVVEEGESFWTIAHNNDLSVDELQKLNTDIVPEKLQIGQEILLTKQEPLVSVVVTKEVTVEETIAHTTEYKDTSSLLKGETKVITEGSDGKKSVTYEIKEANGSTLEKNVVNEVVIAEPVTEVVSKGTGSIKVSSRSASSNTNGGSGTLAWPLSSNSITSPYGTRSRGFHSGIDLAAKTGTSVYAAAGGTVELASWYYGYGNCVVINHGNGIKTRYAHLSGYKVSVGDTVSRGQLIALSGNTGNSTGPHLHFEVIVNGSTKNPVNYLK